MATAASKSAAAEALKQPAYLASALKAPRITEAAARLADNARDAGWTHEEYLAALLEREVAARNASGAQLRIRAAGFPPARVSRSSTGTPNPLPVSRSRPWHRAGPSPRHQNPGHGRLDSTNQWPRFRASQRRRIRVLPTRANTILCQASALFACEHHVACPRADPGNGSRPRTHRRPRAGHRAQAQFRLRVPRCGHLLWPQVGR